MGDDDKLTAILLQVGETKGKVSGMCDDLAHIKGKMSAVVTRSECTGKHKMMEEALARTLGEVKQELRQGIAEIKQKTTGQTHAAITPAMLQAAAAASGTTEMTPEQMEVALAERADERAEKRRRLVTWYLGTGAAVIALLGTLGTFVYKMVITLDRVQTAISAQPAEVRREIDRATAKQKIVYVQVPVPQAKDGDGLNDDGTPAPALPPRRPTPKKAAPKKDR